MTNLDEIRWGQIGCGDVTEKKSGPAFEKVPHSRRVIVLGRNPERVRSYATRHGIPAATTDVRAVLEHPEVNAVYIATPPDSHLHFTRLAAAAGKAIYVEKPMARSVAECEEMVAVCRQAGVPLLVGYYRRAMAKFVRVKQLLDAGAVGRPLQVALRLRCAPRPEDYNRQSPPWRVVPAIAGPGGYFMDVAPHQLDLLDYFLGPVSRASGVAANVGGLYAAADSVAGHLTFAGGVTGAGAWCFVADPTAVCDETEIAGDAGLIRYSTFDDSPVRLVTRDRTEEFVHPFTFHVQQPMIENVVAALRGVAAPLSTGDSALNTNRVLAWLLGGG